MPLTPDYFVHVRDVGTLLPGIDRVRIVSSVQKEQLQSRLPISSLAAACHQFQIRRENDRRSRYFSAIEFTATRHADPISILYEHERALGRYSVTYAELAYDIEANSVEDAIRKSELLSFKLRKRYHRRDRIWISSDQHGELKVGLIHAPTLYFEDRKSTVALKTYTRFEKRPGKKHGPPIVRLEWTLRRSAIKTHLRDKTLMALVDADLNAFLEKQLRISDIDHAALARLLLRHAQGADDDQARRLGFLYLRAQATHHPIVADPHRNLEIWQNSASNLDRHLRQRMLAQEIGLDKPDDSDHWIPRNITRYLIDKCFTKADKRIKFNP